jgi:hypothetical protein
LSPIIKVLEPIIIAESKVIEERHHKDKSLYSVRLRRNLAQRSLVHKDKDKVTKTLLD